MNTAKDGVTVTRRAALSGAVGLGALQGLGGVAHAALPDASALSLPVTPRENLQNLVRMTASLDPVDTPWFFNGSIYAVVGEAAPVELMRVQGMEMYHMQRRSADSFMMHGLTVTFMTDATTGDWLEEYKNPYNGQTVAVPVHAATTPPGGGHLYETSGIRPVSAVDRIPDRDLKLWWTYAGDYVWLHNETVYPPDLPQPRKQRQSNFVPRGQFADPDLRSLPSAFTVSFWAPWSKWLGMNGMPGHMVWHASGAKLNSVADLPADFRARVERDYPDMLSVDVSATGGEDPVS